MRAFLAILGTIGGTVVGYFGAMIVGYPIFVYFQGPDRDGGIAMGVAFTIAPVVAVVTAIICLFLVLRLTQPKEPAASPMPDPDADNPDNPDDPDAVCFQPPSGSKTGPDTQTLVAVGVVLVMIIASVIWLNG